jgi:hypothetical protein
MYAVHLLKHLAVISLYSTNIFVFPMETVFLEWYEMDFDVWFT